METTETKKMSLLLTLVAAIAAVASFFRPADVLQPLMDNAFIISLTHKLDAYASHFPEEKLYLHLDKPMYAPGDDIWFSAYIRDGLSLKPSAQSDIVYFELIDPKGAVQKKLKLVAAKGKVAGDFSLDKENPGGLYKLRAYTNWMKNVSDTNYFERQVQVQKVLLPALKMKLDFEKKAYGAGDVVTAKLTAHSNENKILSGLKLKFKVILQGGKFSDGSGETDQDGEFYVRFTLPSRLPDTDGLLNVMLDYSGSTESISRSVPIVLNKIAVEVFPEGGDPVCGFESTYAFRATNEFGKPADIGGTVITEKGHEVLSFESYHNGLGSFRLLPEAGEKYFLKITRPAGNGQTFPLPEALPKGYILSLNNEAPGRVDVRIAGTQDDRISLVAQVRGKIYYSTVIDLLDGKKNFTFSTASFPAGVAQVTVFDSKGIERAERLVFVNKDRQLNVTVQTDKQKYLPREKIKMTLTVKDEKGLPMPANLSMAVVNDQLLSFADDRQGNMLSQLLLQQDLREKIDEPAFYFDRAEKKADRALDLLLLTSGWRRFTWEKLLEEEYPPINFSGEKAILGGTVLDAFSGQPLQKAIIKKKSAVICQTNEKGSFKTAKVDLSENPALTFECEGYQAVIQVPQEYNPDMTVYLYPSGQNPHHWNKKAAWGANMAPRAQAMVFEDRQEMNIAPVNAASAVEFAEEALLKEDHGTKKEQEEQAPMPAEDDKAASGDVTDDRFELAARRDLKKPALPENAYYRSRQFPSVSYKNSPSAETRSDFRSTIYWDPSIEIGYSGKRVIEFYAPDDITSFRAVVEGMSADGQIGRAEETFFTQLPFQLSAKVPAELVSQDMLTIPLTLKNNSDGPLGGIVEVSVPPGLKAMGANSFTQTIMPGEAKNISLEYEVLEKFGEDDLKISFSSCGLKDAVTQKINIRPKGFPVQLSFSGQQLESEHSFTIGHPVKNSLKASLTIFPNVVSDLLTGVEGILQEPYGCFEQTSCTAYPNAMVLDYLKHTGNKDTKLLARAEQLLDRGYKRLTSFETPARGYEWFGANPAHEGLTAYGIMEFVDMKKAGQPVDQVMLDRTALWLMDHKDGKGGFERERRALHDFGRISDDVLNGYIVYAMAEAGYTDLKKEFEASRNKAVQSGDPYLLAMAANAAFSLKENDKGNALLKLLLPVQKADGSFAGADHSITYSQGSSLEIETTALAVLAILKSPAGRQAELDKALRFILAGRSGSGVFSSTQGTILALKALTEFAKYNKSIAENGTVKVFIGNKHVATRSYKAGDKGALTVAGLEEFLEGSGTHKVRVEFSETKQPLPYTLAVNYFTSLPSGDDDCRIDLKTRLLAPAARVGETVRCEVTLRNKSAKEVPSTIAVIGFPAGLSIPPYQLKEMQEKGIFDYYEIRGNSIAVYYRGMQANAVRTLLFDLKAEVPGRFEAPASSAYLYYTSEFKTWTTLGTVTIKK